jgi:hypothetical protein
MNIDDRFHESSSFVKQAESMLNQLLKDCFFDPGYNMVVIRIRQFATQARAADEEDTSLHK